jgi:hypothetical protein
MANQMPAPKRPPATFHDPAAIMSNPSPPSVTSQPSPGLGGDASKALVLGGQAFSQGIGQKPAGYVPTPSGPPGNVGSDGVPFPAAGMGPGTGLTTKSGIQGQTLGKTQTGVQRFPNPFTAGK